MRIKRNDITTNVYQYTATPSADGQMVSIYTIRYSGLPADLQPTGSKFDPALYGINSTPSDVRKMFYDHGFNIANGDVVLAAGVTYMVKGIRSWYSHNEAVLEPYEVNLP